MTTSLLPKELPAGSNYIGGQWVPADDGTVIPVLNPATEEHLTDVAGAIVADALRALEHAHNAQAQWPATSPRQRADLLRATYDAIIARTDEFAAVIVEIGRACGGKECRSRGPPYQ